MAKNMACKQRILSKQSVFKLVVEDQFKILVGKSTDVNIKLLAGHAEIHGTEVELFKWYSLSPCTFITVFTWHGCIIQVRGNYEVAYVVKGSTMILNVTLHAWLEERRIRAKFLNKKGPVVLVVGPNDVDKHSLCQQLINYAVRLDHHPTFIDLDVGQTSISIPGSVGVSTVKKPTDISSGFTNEEVQVYQFGHESVWQSITFYFLLLQRLGINLRSNLRQSDQNVRASGVIISGFDWSEGDNMDNVLKAITLVTTHFKIDALCVLQDESLGLKLKDAMPSNTEVMFLPSVDYVERSTLVKGQSRESCIRNYFYRNINREPYKFEVKFSDIQIFKVETNVDKINTTNFEAIDPGDIIAVPVLPCSELVDRILALSSANNYESNLMYMEVIGFICITKVDMDKKTVTVISPLPGPLPKKILLLSENKFK